MRGQGLRSSSAVGALRLGRPPASASAAHASAGGELVRALQRLGRAMGRLESAAIAVAELPRAQALALLAIARMGRPAMAMLARELDLAPSTVTRLLDPLVRRSLVRRDADPGDRRVVVLALTPSGARTVERLEWALERIHSRVAEAAGLGGRKRLLAAARELAQAIDLAAPRSIAAGPRRPASRRRGPPKVQSRHRGARATPPPTPIPARHR